MSRDPRRFAWAAGVTLILVVAAASSAPPSAEARPAAESPPMAEAPPAGFTGGFGEANCVSCHVGSDVNAFGGSVRIEGLPDAFDPGVAYVLTVVLTADETAVAGFQLSARFEEDGVDAGGLRAIDARTAVSDSVEVSYLHHSRAGSITHDPSGSSWTVHWTAPRSGRTVAFHVAANSGNGDNSPLGDLVYTAAAVVPSVR